MESKRGPAGFTAEERRQRQRLILRDTIALSSLLAIAIVLSFVTYLLFHSFERHRQELAQRWKSRGEIALKQGKPLLALDSLRSALAYEPDDRGLEIELATALAAAGRTQEAIVYFNTLREAEPGNGLINLQLARLAARQGNSPLAIDEYQSAIDGTWFGDGFLRRRNIRFELSKYLISLGRVDEARGQLLIAAGNAPEDADVQLAVASLLAQAGDPRDALDVYRRAAERRVARTVSLVGAAQSAAALGRYLQARNFADAAQAQPDFARQPDATKAAAHSTEEDAQAILALYPSARLGPQARAERVAHLVELAQAQIAACPAPASAAPAAVAASRPAGVAGAVVGAVSGAVSGAVTGTLRAAGIGRKPSGSSASPSTPTPAPAAAVSAQTPLEADRIRLAALPSGRALVRQLARDPAFAQSTLELVYETARASAACKSSAPDDALLLRIAQSPDAVEQL